MGDNKIKDEELEQINGGMSDEEYRRRQENEKKLHGRIIKDAFGNVTFTECRRKAPCFSNGDIRRPLFR